MMLEQECAEQNIKMQEIVVGGGSKVHKIGRRQAFKQYAENLAQRVSKIEKRGVKPKR